MHNLKVISEVLFGDLIEDNTLGDHLSKTSIYKRILLKKKKKRRRGRKYAVKHQNIIACYKNGHHKFIILVLLYVGYDVRVWTHKLFLRYAS